MDESRLNASTLEEIERRLPALLDIADRVNTLLPDALSMGYYNSHDSTIPIAGVSFIDCYHTLAATRYALYEYFIQGAYHREVEANEAAAVWFERYYLDDTALRLYSAAEHLADGIKQMLEIPRLEGRGSEWAKLKKYLIRELPSDTVAQQMITISATDGWKFAIEYRGKWVHNQPPTVQGLGMVYHRRLRWDVSPDGTKRLLVGVRDQPELTTKEIGLALLRARQDFVSVFQIVLDRYDSILEAHGITFSN
jgi:hypothetical protein